MATHELCYQHSWASANICLKEYRSNVLRTETWCFSDNRRWRNSARRKRCYDLMVDRGNSHCSNEVGTRHLMYATVEWTHNCLMLPDTRIKKSIRRDWTEQRVKRFRASFFVAPGVDCAVDRFRERHCGRHRMRTKVYWCRLRRRQRRDSGEWTTVIYDQTETYNRRISILNGLGISSSPMPASVSAYVHLCLYGNRSLRMRR